jgi:hypothetical protein
MRNPSPIALLILCLAIPSCRAADETEVEASAAAEEIDVCEPFTACGGDVEGSWEITDGCFSFMTVSGGSVIPSCPAATMDYVPDAAGGAYAFQADGSYSGEFELVGRLVMKVPMSCLGPRSSCAELEDVDTGRSCVLTAERTCLCTSLLEQSTEQASSGSYTVDGSRLDFSNDISMTYCAQADRLTLETVSQVEMGDTIDGHLKFVLDRRQP